MEFCDESDPTASENSAWRQVLDVLFALASTSRHLPRPTRYAWSTALRARGIPPPVRRALLLRLMQSAALVDLLPGGACYPTTLLPAWFERPAAYQARDLVEAWVRLPHALRGRQERRRIVRKLGHPLGPRPLTTTELRQISTLRLLGLWDSSAEELTNFGRLVLQRGRRSLETTCAVGSSETATWNTAMFSVEVCADQQARNYADLWDLEAFLQPYAPGRYLLTPPALRRAAQRGSLLALAAVLERGAGAPLSPEVRARILDLPQARLLSGSVLEFDSPNELAALRQRPALRRQLEQLLSPRHVYLPEYAQAGALAALDRAGIPIKHLATSTEPESSATALNGPFAVGELADLYSAALAARQVGFGAGISIELLEKISSLLPPALRKAARANAEQAASACLPAAAWAPPSEPGEVPAARIVALQRAADREEAITVWYSQAGAQRAEQRRLTPLLIEQRGLALYLQAYCHRRRANRTFRIDRLLLEEELSNGHGPAP